MTFIKQFGTAKLKIQNEEVLDWIHNERYGWSNRYRWTTCQRNSKGKVFNSDKNQIAHVHQNKFKMAGDPFCVDKKINYHRLVGQKGQYNTSTSRIHQTC